MLIVLLISSCAPASIVEDEAEVLSYLSENYAIKVPESSEVEKSCLWLNQRNQGIILVFIKLDMDEHEFMQFLSIFDSKNMVVQEKHNPWVPQDYEGIDWWNPEKLDFAKKATIWKMPNNSEDAHMEISFFDDEVYLFFRGRAARD